MNHLLEINSLVRSIFKVLQDEGIGGSGGGLTDPGTPDNIPSIAADGLTLEDSGYSKQLLEAVSNLTTEQLSQLNSLGVNITLINKWANMLGVDIIKEWSPTTQYNVGDLVIKDNELYRYTQSSIGAWSSEVVEPTYIVKQMAEIVESSTEVVTLEFASEDDGAVFNGKEVTVAINGGTTTNYTIANNTVLFTINKGKQYSILFPSIVGYILPVERLFSAVYATRTLTITYLRKNETTQLVRIRSIFTTSGNNTSTSPGTGDIKVEITPWDLTTQTYGTKYTETVTLANGICSLYIPVGSLYTVKFPDHFNNGYLNPRDLSFEAAMETNFVVGRYLKNVSETYVINSSGGYAPYAEYDYSTWDGEEEVYLFFNSSTLQSLTSTSSKENCTFMVPLMNFIKGNSFPSTMKTSWGTNGATMLAGNLTYDGYTNTHELIQEATNRGLSVAASTMAASKQITIVTNGESQTLNGFLGAKDQWGTIASNWEVLNTAVNNFRRAHNTNVGSTVYAETASNLLAASVFWTSTQVSSTNAWCLNYGSLYSHSKTHSFIVLPFYAY